ncbi:MAG: hypothetical protein O2931_08135 [Planctomycetota bacterium]|nr:hypothetical protein [Planctomycetota bacterium]MDA1178749.1 hypothetical protein [Planctomycetota bacterium]
MNVLPSMPGAVLAFLVATGWHTALDANGDPRRADSASTLPPITAIAIDEKNGWAIAGSQAGLVVRTWPDLNQIRMLPTHLENIHDMALSPDGTLLLVAGGDPAISGAAELFHWPSGELWKRLEPQADLVMAVAWRDDSKLFALASADNVVKTFTRAAAECVDVIQGHSRSVLAAAFLPGEQGIVTAGVDETVRLWDCSLVPSATAGPRKTFTNHTRQVVGLAVRPAHQDATPVIASIGEDSTVRLWQPTVGRMLRFARVDSVPLAVCWIDQGKSLAVACRDGKVRMVHPDTVKVTHVRDALTGPAYSLAADASGALLVGGVGGELMRLPCL